jgi:hypothetical protein
MTAHPVASWFETRGVAALLTMRVQDLILRSGVSRVSKDEITELENVLTLIPLCGKTNIAADGVLLAAVDGLRHDCRN